MRTAAGTKYVNVELSHEGIEAAIRSLQFLDASLDQCVENACLKLSEMAQARAERDFASLGPQYVVDASRSIDYNVTFEKSGSGYVIRAFGLDVLFLEFGAGIRHSGTHPLGSLFGYVPGSYPGVTHMLNGQSQGLHPGYWKTPSGQYSEGNQPSMGMYNAFQQIQQDAISILREEFHYAGY